MKTGFSDAMDDDLNVSSATATIFRMVRRVNGLIVNKKMDQTGARRIIDAFRKVDTVLNVFDFEREPEDPEVQKLMREREEARRRKDWKLADQLRERLMAMGAEIRDKKII
jgi:cysteinyl-tRNA synthetase